MITPESITNSNNADYLRGLVPADGILKFWINQQRSEGNDIQASITEADLIRGLMAHLDSISGMVFSEAHTREEAQIVFTKKKGLDGGASGKTSYQAITPKIEISWKDSPDVNAAKTFVLRHEIGHLAGLDHPWLDENGRPPQGIESAMSTNTMEANAWGFPEFDKQAIRSLWGEHEIKRSQGKQVLKGTAFADRFFLTNQREFRTRNPDHIIDFNGNNGDRVFFTDSAVGWKRHGEYKFYTIRKKAASKDAVYKAAKRQQHPYAFVYNPHRGELYSDLNGASYGLGKGGGLIAIFPENTVLKSQHLIHVT